MAVVLPILSVHVPPSAVSNASHCSVSSVLLLSSICSAVGLCMSNGDAHEQIHSAAI